MNLIDILFPKRCVGCKKVGDYICPDCFTTISFDIKNICIICNKASLDGLTHPICKTKYSLDGAFCGVVYKGIVRKLVYQFKYNPYLSGLSQTLTNLFYESLIQQEFAEQIITIHPVFIPIPLSSQKLRKRGYNQAELLAVALATKTNGTVSTCLTRTKETKPQYGLKREERKENMKDAFVLNSDAIFSSTRDPKGISRATRNDMVILVDDILTTGSTLSEAAKVLKKAGVKKVYGICFAREQ